MTTGEGHELTPTERRLLDAAFRVWASVPPSVLFGGLSVSRIAKEAGVTRATFYSYWPSVDDYLVDLLGHLTSLDPHGWRPAADGAMRHLVASSVRITPDLYQAAEQQIRAVMADPAFPLRLGFASKFDDPVTARLLAERYRLIEERTEVVSASIRDSWGREGRPPLTPALLQAVYTAFAEGFAARHSVDPEAVPVSVHGQVILGLTMLLTRRKDDHRSLDEVLDSANTWPAVGMRLSRETTHPELPGPGPGLDSATAREVVLQARRLQASMAWHELTLADIANVTGLGEELLVRGFGSKAGLAMAIFMMNVHERHRSIDLSGDPARGLRALIAAGQAELQRAPGLTQNVLQILVSDTTLPIAGLIDWDPLSDVVAQVEATQEAGQMRADIDARDLAVGITRLLLLEATRTGASREGPDMVELLLVGAGLAPADGSPVLPSYVPGTEQEEPRPDPFIG